MCLLKRSTQIQYMYYRTMCCHGLKDMLYCPHETGRSFYRSGGSGFLSVNFAENPRIKRKIIFQFQKLRVLWYSFSSVPKAHSGFSSEASSSINFRFAGKQRMPVCLRRASGGRKRNAVRRDERMGTGSWHRFI